MSKNEKSAEIERFLDELSLSAFGRARTLAKAGNCCVCCGGVATQFRDEISRKEFGISGLCQTCQDETFGTEE